MSSRLDYPHATLNVAFSVAAAGAAGKVLSLLHFALSLPLSCCLCSFAPFGSVAFALRIKWTTEIKSKKGNSKQRDRQRGRKESKRDSNWGKDKGG